MTWTDAMFRRAAELWRAGFNTYRIAAALLVEEHEVANRIEQIKALAK